VTAVVATFEVALAWAVALVALTGLGVLVRRALGARRAGAPPDDLFWFGWVAALAFLQLWNLAWPVSGVAELALIVAGAGGWALGRRERAALVGAIRALRAREWLALGLVALWVANLALGAPHNGDSGLYHFAAVRWASEQPIVPGLGNLLGRLAFNSSYFLWVALLGNGPFAGRGFHLANGVLLLPALWRGILATGRIAGGGTRVRPAALLDALLLFPLVERVWDRAYLTSPSPDFPVFVLFIVVTSALGRVIDAESDAPERTTDATALVVLASVAGVVTKLSFAGFGVAAVAVALLRRGCVERGSRRRVATLLAWVAVVIVPWLARGVILSGYPFYPYPGVRVPVPWAVPHAAAKADYDWVRSWARLPSGPPAQVLGGWAWFAPWVRSIVDDAHTLFMVGGPLLSAALAAAILTYRAVTNATAWRATRRLLLVPLAATAGLVYWFLTAPAVRFAESLFWALAAGLAVAVAFAFGERRLMRAAAWASLALAVAGLVHENWQRGPLLVGAGRHGAFRPPPRPRLTAYTTRWGFELFEPASGQECWDAPLPCTPYPSPDLRLRVPGRLDSGFLVATPAQRATDDDHD
jgi:hypothetical protein